MKKSKGVKKVQNKKSRSVSEKGKTIEIEEIRKKIPDFVERYYPKGMKERGFAIVVASQMYCYLIGLSKSK